MTKILVPIDFTKVSFSAFQYAVKLSEHLKASLTLIHVINGSFITVDSMFLETVDMAKEVAMKRLHYLTTEYTKKVGVKVYLDNIDYDVRFGVSGFTIADYANDLRYDYVIVGTRDNHNIVEKLLGTSSSVISKLTNCPVILIHENTKWKNIKKVIFTIDNNTDFEKSISTFANFNKTFDADTDFIHIKLKEDQVQIPQEGIINALFKIQNPSYAFQVKSIYGGDIVQSIVDYCIFEKADMLVMVHKKHTFISDFFDKSVSLQTSDGLHLPIMIIAEKSLINQ